MLRAVLLVLVLAVPAGLASAAAKTSHEGGVEVFGQPDRTDEVAGRPLGSTLKLFRSYALAAPLPLPVGAGVAMPPLSEVATRLRGDPGRLLLGRTRRVATPVGVVYFVPTARGWVCVQGPRFATCHRGLLREGLTWNFYSTDEGIEVVGVASDAVAGVTLNYGKKRVAATLNNNVFTLSRPVRFSSATHLPPLGHLIVRYRNRRPPASLSLRR